MTIRLDISVGPVQGFVAQSRRTRDLWGSSYLLSFLTAHAALGARKAGGRIVQPGVGVDPLFQWVTGAREGPAPRIGSVPNHFVVETDGDASSVARASIQALETAWQRVCVAVWERFVEHAHSRGVGAKHIWDRQVLGFWEVLWAAGDPASGGALLARRKHWRTHRLPDEPGDKCTVMHDFQELSGFVRAESTASREKQDAFWGRVRGRTGALDLREDERLCAVALVKRLFPRVANKALGWEVGTSHWPSTAYVAAVPWILQAAQTAPGKSRKYAEAVLRCAPSEVLAERRPSFASLDRVERGDFQRLDANYFHRSFVEDKRLCPLKNDATAEDRISLVHLLQELEACKTGDGRPLDPAPTFYALLLADGDRLGRLVASQGAERVGQALATFTGGVPSTVARHDGVTVYAGGDDVLAMLPVTSALACASALSRDYQAAFNGTRTTVSATLSAAVVFAHVRLPLGAVLGEAHRLLDDVAKDANGRDSLAVAVLKRGGLHCQWVTTWTRPQTGGTQTSAIDAVGALAKLLEAQATEPGLSSGLLYRLRETLGLLCGWPRWTPGAWGALPRDLDVHAFLHAEVQHSLAARPEPAAGGSEDELTDRLIELLGPSRSTNGAPSPATPEAGVDAYLLARFLAGPAHEEGEE